MAVADSSTSFATRTMARLDAALSAAAARRDPETPPVHFWMTAGMMVEVAVATGSTTVSWDAAHGEVLATFHELFVNPYDYGACNRLFRALRNARAFAEHAGGSSAAENAQFTPIVDLLNHAKAKKNTFFLGTLGATW